MNPKIAESYKDTKVQLKCRYKSMDHGSLTVKRDLIIEHRILN